MALRPPRFRPIRRDRAGLALAALAVGLLWLAIGLTIRRQFDTAADLALRETANLARILEAQVAGRIDAIDATLRFSQVLFARDPAAFSLGDWSVIGGDPETVSAVLVSPQGFALATRDGPLAEPLDLRDRPHIQAHLRDPAADRLEIGWPVRGPLSGRPIIAFSRSLRTAAGEPGGIMLLALDATLFSRLHQALDLRDGRILLVGLDGVIRARSPDGPVAPGDRLPEAAMTPFRAGLVERTDVRSSALDGTPGFATWRRVAGYPLLVTVRLAADRVLAESRRYRLQWLGLGALFTLLTAGLCGAVARMRRMERASRAALEGTFAHVGHGIMMVDAAGRVVLANARVSDMLGLPPGLMVPGRPLEEIIRWQEAAGEYGSRAPPEHLASQDPSHGAAPYIWERTRPDGTVLEIRVDHLPDGGFVRSWTDVTEARRTAAAIAAARDAAVAARAALSAAFEQAPLGIILLGADHRVEIMNSLAVALLDLPPALAVPGTPGAEILRLQLARGDLAAQPELELDARHAIADGDVPDRAYVRPSRDGRLLEIRGRHLADGRVIRTYADISERQAALRQQQAAQAAAASALRSRSEFLATVSHELRTPLHAVIGFAEVLLQQQPGPAQAASLREIESAGRQLLALVDDILEVARLEQGRLTLRETAFDPAATLRELAGPAAARAAARGLRFTLELDPALPAEAFGDAGRLRQVLVKLLDNAVKFTAAGGIGLSATVLAETASGWRLDIAVADTGIGIPAEARERLFDPFVQADASSARRYNGAGLGLAVARMVVEAMGGTIAVESAPGRGSTFRIAVPLARMALAPA
ncbi:PAS-domain containing protein [Paeniroseomonas aquatica]|uniref:histidine kinase n=1 Tax=Paeniroseomonas aquatica TaxID=373043 RepID=A0ABT8A4J1_9PROT|nr:PAS-domain containing protein [Paeniroseomonas aquatica]MDN3564697.1 PAS-domain containing protein [Paeniroseomonas aquatica]